MGARRRARALENGARRQQRARRAQRAAER